MSDRECGVRMRLNSSLPEGPLHGRVLVITRPVGTADALARQIRALGGMPVLLPGMALRGPDDVAAVRAGLRDGLADPWVIFTSPAAVRQAAVLAPLRTDAVVLAVGRGTARALHRRGVAHPLVPARQDSEGLLDLPVLRDLEGQRVTLVGAPGGRGVLRAQLLARGARLREVMVYRRVPPRLDRRHVEAVLGLPRSARVLLSSHEALQNLCRLLPSQALECLLATVAVVSSERIATAARRAGFSQIEQAASALADDLLAAAAR